jgi:two-component system, cell cycle response regulator DivK
MPTHELVHHVSEPPLVVLVEDHADTSDLYGDFLNFSGYRVLATADPNEGFDLAVRFDAAIVVTDYWLAGGQNGGDLCQRLKQDDRTRHIPTLLVTASSLRKQVETSLAAGCAVVRLKPYLPDALVRDIRTMIDRQPIEPWPHEYNEGRQDEHPGSNRKRPKRTKH